ncbi:MAG TPA: NAD(+) diphosphatase [Clostridiales bacterium]|nr:NAD(+) diphosphatase [Clostridiales bacterium]
MLHEIDGFPYHCEYFMQKPKNEDFLLVFEGDDILLRQEAPLILPKIGDFQEEPFMAEDFQYLFSIASSSFFLLKKSCPPKRQPFYFASIQAFRECSPQWLAFAGVTAYHLSYWYAHNRYCGACAAPLIHREDERALVCPACGNIKYPDIAVAIIVGIVHGEKILLTRYCTGVYRRYALIAGFVEIGESLYDAVRREVYEEVGLKVKHIRYYDNQPWGFSQSLLVGFFAELDGGEEITLAQDELAEAAWVRREDLTVGPSEISLTRKMMAAYKNREILFP